MELHDPSPTTTHPKIWVVTAPSTPSGLTLMLHYKFSLRCLLVIAQRGTLKQATGITRCESQCMTCVYANTFS